MKRFLLILGAINLAFLQSAPALAEEPAKLLISKVQIVGAEGEAGHDLIEIHNPNDFSVPLAGYRLVKRTKTGSSDYSVKSWQGNAEIAAGSYHIWASSADGFADSIGADSSTSASLAADNAVAIRFGSMDSGQVIDAVGWGESTNGLVEAAPFPFNPAAGQSLIRSALADTDNNADDFDIYPPQNEPKSSTNTSGSAEIQVITPDIYINEVYPSPEAGENEWLELYIEGSASLDGYYLTEGAGSRTELSGAISGYYLISEINGNLNNTGDTIMLMGPEGRVIDALSYGDIGKAAVKAPAKGQSISRLKSGEFALTAPTPGYANDKTNIESETADSISSSIVFSEIMANPVGADLNSGEFIELKNLADHSVAIGGWQISNQAGQIYNIPETVYLKAGSYRLFRRSKTKLALNNLSESLSLIDSNGKIADKVNLAASPEGQSRSRNKAGDFVWSLSATPGYDNLIIEPNQEPQAVFAAPAETKPMTPVYLDASDSIDPENGPLWYSWDLGDGRTSKQLAPEIVYEEPGSYQIKLSVFDGQATSSQIKTIRVLGVKNTAVANNEAGQRQAESPPLSLAANQPPASEPAGSFIYGVVAAPPGLAAKQYFYVLPMAPNGEMNEACIQVYNYEADFGDLSIGDYVRLKGELYEISSGWRIKIQGPEDIVTLDQDYILIEQNIALNRAPEHLNQLVSLEGVLINCLADNCVLSDGLSEIVLDIKEASNINTSNLATGSEYRATGIVRQVRDSIKLLLRQPADLIAVSDTPTLPQISQSQDKNTLPAGEIKFSETADTPWQDYLLPLALGLNVFFVGRLLANRKNGKK